LFNVTTNAILGASIDVNNRAVFGASVAVASSGLRAAFAGNGFNMFTSGDTNGWEDIVIRSGTQNILATVGFNGDPADRGSFEPAITADGRFVAFASNASNLILGDAPGTDVFLRDLLNNNTVRINSTPSGGAATNAGAFSASITDDGRYVAFIDSAADIVAGDTNAFADAFVRDVQ
jgi:hypothetical protein